MATATRLTTLEGPGQARVNPADIPDPDTFDRKRGDLRGFARLKVEGNADEFPDDQNQLRYAFGFLTGAAYNTSNRTYRTTGSTLRTWTVSSRLWELHLTTTTARRELERLQQKGRGFPQCWADFQRLISIVRYDEQALERDLNREVKAALVTQDTPPDDTWDQFVVRLNRLDNRIRAYAQELRTTPAYTAPRSPRRPKPRPRRRVPRMLDPPWPDESECRSLANLASRTSSPDLAEPLQLLWRFWPFRRAMPHPPPGPTAASSSRGSRRVTT